MDGGCSTRSARGVFAPARAPAPSAALVGVLFAVPFADFLAVFPAVFLTVLLAALPAALPAALLAALLAAPVALAAEPGSATSAAGSQHLFEAPLPWRNAGAGTASAGLPRASGAQLPAPGTIDATLLLELASQFTQDSESGERVVLDVETTTLVFLAERSFAVNDGPAHWSASIELPWVRQDGGFLDGLINDYHDVLGLRDGGRSRAPNDQVRLRWDVDGTTRLALTQARSGLGDIRLGLARRFLREPDRIMTLRLGLELPTGDADALIGSEALAFTAGLHATDRRLLSRWGVATHLSAGLLLQQDSEITGDRTEPLALWGNWTLARPIGARWMLKAQLDAHSRTADSAVRQIGGWSLQGSLGAAVRLGESLLFEGGFVEDLRPGSAPDIVFQFALRGRL